MKLHISLVCRMVFLIRIMIRTKNIQNSEVTRNCPYYRRKSSAGSHFRQEKVKSIGIPS